VKQKMSKKKDEKNSISKKIIREIDDQIKNEIDLKSFKNACHKIITNRIKEQLK